MAVSTALIGPYDDIPTQSKIRIMCGVPLAVTSALFDNLFNQRGVQDKILARMFHIFYLELSSESIQAKLAEAITIHDREEILNSVLNKLATLQTTYLNQDAPATNPTES